MICFYYIIIGFGAKSTIKLDTAIIYEKDCEGCPKYESRFIEFPIVVNNIKVHSCRYDDLRVGSYVRIRLCAKEYEGKTHLGIYLGELPISNGVLYNKESKELSISPHMNPAIYVPALKKIIYGYESWWTIIPDEEFGTDKEITDELINNQWYVQLLNAMAKKEDPASGGAE